MPTMNRVLARSEEFVFRAIAGETILVPIRNEVADLVAIYRLNATGAFAWERMDGTSALGAIAAQMAASFEVPADRAACDLAAFAADLEAAGAVVAARRDGDVRPAAPAASRQPYEPPALTRVPLDARCAVLGFCKQAGTGAGPALPGCRDPLFSPCLSQGS